MKKIVVLGGGISGYGSAILARKMGFDVFLSDSGRLADRFRMKLEAWGVPYEEGGHTEERVLAASEVIKSPGIPETAPLVCRLRERGVPVISEIEFAGRYLDGAKTICITGSNGKTTTTSLIYKILHDAGYRVALGGNIGESFAYSVATGRYDWYVLELSSFQLDGMYRFRADIGVLTNITPDHLDRYDHSFAKYAAAKMRITQNQRPTDCFIYSADGAPDIVQVQTGDYSIMVDVLVDDYNDYTCPLKLTAGDGFNEFVLDGLFGFTDYAFIGEYDPTTLTITFDGTVLGMEDMGPRWGYGIAYVDETQSEIYTILSNEADEPCVISVNEDGTLKAFTTSLQLVGFSAADGKITRMYEQIEANTPISKGAESGTSARIAGRKAQLSTALRVNF